MEEIKKTTWTYAHSAALGMRYAYRPDPGGGVQIMTEDKVLYSPEEVAALESAGIEIDLQLHRAKKIFGGTIIIKRAETREPEANDAAAVTATGKPIPPDEYPGGGNIPLF